MSISADRVGIRRGPSEDYAVIARSDAGDQWQVIGRNEVGDWLQLCCLEDGQVGWTLATLLNGDVDVVSLPIIVNPEPRAIADLNPLPIYAGPFYSYETIGSVPGGTSFTLTGRDRSGQWWQLCCVDGQEGWVYFETVLLDGSADDLPLVEVPPPDDG